MFKHIIMNFMIYLYHIIFKRENLEFRRKVLLHLHCIFCTSIFLIITGGGAYMTRIYLFGIKKIHRK